MRLLRHMTGRHRTRATNRVLGLLLAFNAGAVNAGGFLVVHMYTSHMTGFLSLVADNLVLGNTTLVLSAIGTLWAFMSGAGTTAILVNWARHQRLRSGYALPLLLEAALMLLFGLMGAITLTWRTPFSVPLTVLLLAYIMGLQNALVTKMSSAQIRTTHIDAGQGPVLEPQRHAARSPGARQQDAPAHVCQPAGHVHRGRRGGRGGLQACGLHLGGAAGSHLAGLVAAAAGGRL